MSYCKAINNMSDPACSKLYQDYHNKAYHNFDLKKVAKYTAKDRARLLKDPGIIRNRLKVKAAIENAKKILELQKEQALLRSGLKSILL